MNLRSLIVLENREFNQNHAQFKILHFTAWAFVICAFLLGRLDIARNVWKTYDSGRITVLRRRRLGFVFQLHDLTADLTVLENLRVPAIAAHTRPRRRRTHLQTHRTSRHRPQSVPPHSGSLRRRTPARRHLPRPHAFAQPPPCRRAHGLTRRKTGDTVFNLLKILAEACHRMIRVHDG